MTRCLCWNSVAFSILPNEDAPAARPTLMASITTEYGKTSTVVGRGFGVFESATPIKNTVMLLITLALEDGIFKHFETIEQVLDSRHFTGQNASKKMLLLAVKDEWYVSCVHMWRFHLTDELHFHRP